MNAARAVASVRASISASSTVVRRCERREPVEKARAQVGADPVQPARRRGRRARADRARGRRAAAGIPASARTSTPPCAPSCARHSSARRPSTQARAAKAVVELAEARSRATAGAGLAVQQRQQAAAFDAVRRARRCPARRGSSARRRRASTKRCSTVPRVASARASGSTTMKGTRMHLVVEELLLAQPVVAQEVAVVGGEHDQRVVEPAAGGQARRTGARGGASSCADQAHVGRAHVSRDVLVALKAHALVVLAVGGQHRVLVAQSRPARRARSGRCRRRGTSRGTAPAPCRASAASRSDRCSTHGVSPCARIKASARSVMYAVSECSSSTRAGRCTLRMCQPRDDAAAVRRRRSRSRSTGRRSRSRARAGSRGSPIRRPGGVVAVVAVDLVEAAGAQQRAALASPPSMPKRARPVVVGHHVRLAGERDACARRRAGSRRAWFRATDSGTRFQVAPCESRSGRCRSSCATGRRRRDCT